MDHGALSCEGRPVQPGENSWVFWRFGAHRQACEYQGSAAESTAARIKLTNTHMP
jgi:hypothetical protein